MVSPDATLEICVLGRVMIRARTPERCVLGRFMFRPWGISSLEYWILEGEITTWSQIVFFYSFSHISVILFISGMFDCIVVSLLSGIVWHCAHSLAGCFKLQLVRF